MRLIRFILFIYISAFLAACSDSSETVDNFDRATLLENMAENIIKPNYADLQTQVNTLQTATNTFASDASEVNLTALQTTWETAFTSWLYCAAFNFGPADLTLGTLDQLVATFPVSTTRIEELIVARDFDLSDNFERDIRGFLAIEYLIFDLDGNTDILEKYTTNGEDRKSYLQAVVNLLKEQVDEVTTGWESYTSEFLSSVGTENGSSTTQLFNEFSRSFEAIKNFKVGLPAGLRAGQTSSEPEKVEAYYSGKSLQFIKTHFSAIEDIWLGRTKDGQDGIGFEEYLLAVEGGESLVADTKEQLAGIQTALDAIPASSTFSETIESNVQTVNDLYTELQKNTRFFKSDMSSLLGIAITFSSGDGD